MEAFCGTCLKLMIPLKKEEIKKQERDQKTSVQSVKCTECGHIVNITWTTKIIHEMIIDQYGGIIEERVR